jgi:hypothetical protein
MRHLFHEFALAAFAVTVIARPAAVAGQDTAATAGPAVKVLAGDPDKPEPSTVRITFPAGFHTDPHHHGVDLTATVRSGMLFMGWNTRFDTTLVVAFPPGSRSVIPAGKDHFDWFPDGAEVDYESPGPWQTVLVDSAGKAIPSR